MRSLRPRRPLLPAALLALALAGPQVLAAQSLEEFEKRVTLHRLDNGWIFIILERPEAPVFSFATLVDVGAAQEVPGITGLAHMFEHMAFKGTPNIGTKDWEAEQKALETLEAAYQSWQTERLRPSPDAARLEELEKKFRDAQQEAAQYVEANEFGDIINRAGGVGLNAFTSSDFTGYFYSLPANKLELFAYLESERFLHPVFREYYKERDVVQEERRLRTESQPIGRLIEQFLSTAFIAHPYHQPVVGYMSDLQSISITDARAFYEKHYAPTNMVTTIVGDVDAQEVMPLLQTYFGRIPAGGEPEPLRTVEPPQIAERTVVIEDPSQPIYLEGYHVEAVTGPDAVVYDAIDDILSRGRTSRLFRRLVRDEKAAVQAGSFSGLPGEKYPGLWIAFAVPAKGRSNEEAQTSIREEIERLKRQPVSDAELQKFRTRARADLIRSLDSNQGLAFALAEYQQLFGDWRELFGYLEKVEAVTAEDIQRVARETFTAQNRTVGKIVTEAAEQPAAPQEAPAEQPAEEEASR
ncbi:MAG: M16 family metallopeptidase [Thermoanaerobaculia bacterium]